MAEVSIISDGVTEYTLRDSVARQLIADMKEQSAYLGVTTTPITDGSTVRYVVIDGETIEVARGNIVIYGNAQFLWTGSKWEQFGDLTTLGKLAYKDEVTVPYTPQGEVSNTDIDYTPEGSITNTSTKESFVSATYDAEHEGIVLTTSQAVTDVESEFTGTTATLQTTSTFTGQEAEIVVSGD